MLLLTVCEQVRYCHYCSLIVLCSNSTLLCFSILILKSFFDSKEKSHLILFLKYHDYQISCCFFHKTFVLAFRNILITLCKRTLSIVFQVVCFVVKGHITILRHAEVDSGSKRYQFLSYFWGMAGRYTTFFVMYPTGICSEAGLVFVTLPFMQVSCHSFLTQSSGLFSASLLTLKDQWQL